jgi:hypothetical protein
MMKEMKRRFLNIYAKCIFALMIIGTLSGCNEIKEYSFDPVVYLDHQSLALYYGDELQLAASPASERDAIQWTSEDANVATVSSSGLITATGVGETRIVASLGTGKTSLPVTVTVPTADRVTGITGNHRAGIELEITNDRVKTVKVTRLDNEQSQETEVNFQSGTVTVYYTGLDEGRYSFRVICIDKYENESVPVEISVEVYDAMFLTGTAISGGTVLLTKTEGKFKWQGNLNVGAFKILYDSESELPSLNRGANDNTLVERTEASQPDNMFQVTRAGLHTITVDVENLTISIERNFHYYFEHIYLVGDAVIGTGWNPGAAVELTWNDGLFVYEGTLSGGDGDGGGGGDEDAFKILTMRDWGGYNLRPLAEWASITDTRLQAVEGGNDNLKWKIKPEETGYYRVTLDMSAMTIVFERLW